MNRRGFFKCLATTGLVASAAPMTVVAALRGSSLSASQFKRYSNLMDYDTKIGLATQLNIGDDRYRHAIVVPAKDWEAFTPVQREQTWKLVERQTYEFAMKRRTS